MNNLEVRKQEIADRKKELKKEEKALERDLRRDGKNVKIKTAIMGSFLHKKLPNDFMEYAKRPEFDKYVNRNKDRALFGLTLLEETEEKTEEKTEENVDAGIATEEPSTKKGLFG